MPDAEPARPARATVLLALAALVVVAFVALQPPLRRVLGSCVPLLQGAGFLLACAGWGLHAARLALGKRAATAGERFLIATALGAGVTGSFVMVLGLAGGYGRLALGAWTVAGALLAAHGLLRDWRPAGWRIAIDHPLDRVGCVLLAATAFVALPEVLAPEVSTDSLEYHLMIPRLWLEAGGMTYLPGLVESNYPSLAEQLYVPVLALSGAAGAKGFHFAFAVLLVAAVHRLARALSPAAPAWLAAAAFASMPIVSVHLGHAWNDMSFTLFVVLGVLVLVRRLDDAGPDAQPVRAAVLSALLLGLAAWTKYTALLPLGGFAAAHALGLARRRLAWRESLAFGAVFAVACVPWLAKNLAFTGNPVAPFLSGVIPTRDWPPHAAEYFHRALTEHSYEWDLRTWLTFPGLLALRPRMVELAMGAAPLLLAPLAFLRTASASAWAARAFLAGTLLAWLPVHVEARSLLALLAVLCAVGVAALGERAWTVVRARPAIAALAVATIVPCIAYSGIVLRHLFDPVPPVAGLELRRLYVTRLAPGQRAFDWLNERADVGTVLVVGPRTSFWLDAPAIFTSFADTPAAEVVTRPATDPEDLARRLRERGVTHVVVDVDRYEQDERAGLYSWSPTERERFQRFLERHARLAHRAEERLLVYELVPGASAPEPAGQPEPQ